MKTLTFLLIAFGFFVAAQGQNNKQMVVEPGNLSSLSPQDLYTYPDFTLGKVCYKDGSVYDVRLNYNLLLGEMLFLDNRGDTLSVARENELKYISVREDTFYYQKKYLRQVASNSIVKLAQDERLRIVDRQKIGAYGQPTSTGSITSFSSITVGSRVSGLTINENTVLSKESNYYISDPNTDFKLLTKKGLLKLAAVNDDAVEAYIKDHAIDLTKKDDLIKLAAYLESTSKKKVKTKS